MPIPIDSLGNERYIIGQPLPEATNPSYSFPLLPLFDSGYYLAQNPDVAAAGMPATYHYIHYGWKEGRDPSPYFDTSFYLELNPDVAAAGVNPLEHYNTYGWREGRRDPSPTFDTSYYLESNPDVAAAGMNPLEHFVRYGAAEGRASSPPPPPPAPEANSTVEVTLRTFIPSEAIGVPYASGYVNAGDGRTEFTTSDDASFRTAQSAMLTFGPNGEAISGTAENTETGMTKQYSKADASLVAGWRWDLNDGAIATAEAKLDPNLIPGPEIAMGSENADFALTFHLSGTNPLPPPMTLFTTQGAVEAPPPQEWVPAFNAEIDLLISQNESGVIEYQVDGTHDGFPAYELYINDTFVYTFNPISAGTGPTHLFPDLGAGEDTTIPETSGIIYPPDYFFV